MKLPSQPPILETERLLLRPFSLSDAAEVARLASAREIGDTTLLIPHPYGEGVAERWIEMQPRLFQAGKLIALAMVLRQSAEVFGAIGLSLHKADNRAEVGYWVGVPFWGKGYCTEAVRALSRWAFDILQLNRLIAHHFTRNPASGRVLIKAGFQHEGTLREHVSKWNRFEGLECYGALRGEWKAGGLVGDNSLGGASSQGAQGGRVS